VRHLLTERTAAIIAVHLFGQPAPMRALRYPGVWLIEDAAQAHGARYEGERVGSIGDIAAFSFYGNKIITTGEGGAVTTNDPMLAREARFYGHQGQTSTYMHPEVGYNYRMTNLAAAIGCGQLAHARDMTLARYQIAREYADHMPVTAKLQSRSPGSAHWLIGAQVPDAKRAAAKLHEAGIETRPFFLPLHTLPMFEGEAPVSEDLSEHGIMLPLHPGMTKDNVRTVCRVLGDAL
jgi:perosamine synthetase